jgi:hypothetical protein
MTTKEWDTKYVHFTLDDNVVVVAFKQNLVIVKEIAEEIVSSRLLFIEGNSYPTLADIRIMKSMDKASRECFASAQAQQGVKAGAVLSDSVFTTFLGNFFLKIEYFNKSPLPTRLFTNKDNAIRWLKQYR